MTEEVQKHSVHTLVFRSLKRTHDMFVSDQPNSVPFDEKADQIKMKCKARDEYGPVLHLPPPEKAKADSAENIGPQSSALGAQGSAGSQIPGDNRLALVKPQQLAENAKPLSTGSRTMVVQIGEGKTAIVPRKAPTMPKPDWHPPWKLMRVISGHHGWVRAITVEPGNEWFVTGAGDRVIKIWDLASGTLKLSLTGHVSTVRGLAVSKRLPYLFSCGEDKQVKCWDLEQNKVVRHYHGHLSACYGLDLHPTLDLLATCGRDSAVRLWDIRTKAAVHVLSGHTNTVATVRCQAAEPQIISGSHDCTVRLWDIVAGKTRATLTHHKKSIRAVTLHPTQYTFASASPDAIKQWKFPDGQFVQNLTGHSAIVNCLALNSDNVLVSGGDNGSMYMWDWRTGYNFQRQQALVQPGSIDSESGIFAATFDMSGSRLLTAEADKTIKIYKEDDEATEETHPINWKPNIIRKNRY